jgi:hypothetical protein
MVPLQWKPGTYGKFFKRGRTRTRSKVNGKIYLDWKEEEKKIQVVYLLPLKKAYFLIP